MGFYSNGVGWVRFFLAESQSRLYPHMREKFERDPTPVSKKASLKFNNRYVQGFVHVFAKLNLLGILLQSRPMGLIGIGYLITQLRV